MPQLLDAFARFRESHPDARLLLVGAPRPESTSPAGSRTTGSTARSCTRTTSTRPALGADGRRRRVVSLRSPTMGETSGTVDSRALARQAAARQRRRLVLGASRRRRAEGRARRARGRPSRRRDGDARRSGRARRHGRAAARSRCERARRSTTSPSCTRPPSRRRPAATAVREAVLREVSAAAADVGLRGRLERGGCPRPRAGRGRDLTTAAAARAGALARAVPMWAWLTALVLVSAAIRFALARRMPAPWIMVDELIYSELAKSFAAGAHFLVRDQPAAIVRLRLSGSDLARRIALFSSVPDAHRPRRRSTRSSCRSRPSRRTCLPGGCSARASRSRPPCSRSPSRRSSTPGR